VSPELAALVEVLADQADHVIADDITAALAMSELARTRPLVYSAHNLESTFRRDRDWGSVKSLRRFESRLLSLFAEVWMPSRADVRGAARLAPATPLRYVPNVVDVADHRVVRPSGHRAVFVADFTYGPNREGLHWLVEHVLPRVRAEFELSVVGRGLEPRADFGPSVRVHGFVDDLDAIYAGSACALVPLLTGGGSPLKFVEALARGLPVVATPQAARGLDVTAGEQYLEGGDAGAFAAAIDEVLTSGIGESMGRAGRALAEREYSIESLAARLYPSSARLTAHPESSSAHDLP
jgi:glycosyltransferase involved in cell wall biosynthesis